MCNDKNIKELLPAFEKQELDGPGQERIAAHLAACKDCRAELALLRTMREETVPDPGDAFWDAMRGRVSRAVQEQEPWKNPYDLRLWKQFIFSVRTYAAAAAVVLVLSWIISPGRLPQHSPASALNGYHEYAGNPDLVIHQLSPVQLQSIDIWAADQLSQIAKEAASVSEPGIAPDISEDLAELSNREMERLSALLKSYGKEGSS